MKLDISGNKDGVMVGVDSSLQMGIDLSDPSKIFYILSQGFYKDPKRAVIQEITSNMIDSYTEAGKNILDNPAFIVLTNETITFKDFGIGISEERMTAIMSKFFASTKGHDNSQIGTFGLGSKAPFAYTNQFTIISVFNGIERGWLFSKDGSEMSIISLFEKDSNLPNQTSVIISIKNDAKEWYDKIVSTISYFRGVIFECNISVYWNKSSEFNNAPLIEGNHFFYKKESLNRFHICLDQVIYNIDTSDLDIYLPDFPFGLKFSIEDGIVPNPNRESILFSSKTKVLILKKLRDAIEELRQYQSDSNLPLYQFFDENSDITFQIQDEIVKIKPAINSVCVFLSISPFYKINNTLRKIPNIKNKRDFFLSFLKKRGHITRSKVNIEFENIYSLSIKNSIFFDLDFTPNIKTFLREYYSEHRMISLSTKKLTLYGKGGYVENLDLKSVPKEEWREIVKVWQEEQQKFLDQIEKFDKDEFIEWQSKIEKKLKPRRKLQDTEIKVQLIENKVRGYGTKLTPYIYDGKDKNKIYLYTIEKTDNDLLVQYSKIPRVIPITIKGKEIEKIKNFPNFVTEEQFRNSKYFKRLVFKYHYGIKCFYLHQTLRDSYLEHSKLFRDYRYSISGTKSTNFYANSNPQVIVDANVDKIYEPWFQYLIDIESKTEHLRVVKKTTQIILLNHRIKSLKKQLNNCRQQTQI